MFQCVHIFESARDLFFFSYQAHYQSVTNTQISKVRFQLKGMDNNTGEHNFLTKTQVINAADPIFDFISTNAANFNDVKSIFQNGNYGEYYEDAISLLKEIGFIKDAKNKSGQDIYELPEWVKLHMKGKRFTSFYSPKKMEAIKHQFVGLLKKIKAKYHMISILSTFPLSDLMIEKHSIIRMSL